MEDLKPIGSEDQNTITVQIPSTVAIAGKRPIIPTSFALVIIFFFFTFCDFKCGGQKLGSLTGINLVTGVEMAPPDSFMGIETPGKSINGNIWAILALAAAIIGLGVFLIKDKREALIGTGAGAIGAGSLIILRIAINSAISNEGQGQLTADFKFPYWGALIAFLIAGTISYLRMKQAATFNQVEEQPDNTSDET
ncbi:hypothetical protein C7N43_00320 [Sphingobacteriales bacterium UPWRP_1]|nr:hypothetical protein BVG80_15250 [Sphingobacteriales bacterium TSM_CSM]PSJ79103.1 hypothetical protein C7N43_00320 [Sphingobacteriales bacterium UPWRP_1]